MKQQTLLQQPNSSQTSLIQPITSNAEISKVSSLGKNTQISGKRRSPDSDLEEDKKQVSAGKVAGRWKKCEHQRFLEGMQAA